MAGLSVALGSSLVALARSQVPLAGRFLKVSLDFLLCIVVLLLVKNCIISWNPNPATLFFVCLIN